MTAFSVRAPHALAIVQGRKVVEYRNWAPVDSQLPARLAVHQSGRNGAIIGHVTVTKVEDLAEGGTAWHLADAVQCESIPCTGRPYFFDVEV